jgi:hypothetical protein
MGAKLDLLIKECEDYLNKNISRFEPSYKKFVEDYNKAINDLVIANKYFLLTLDIK